MLEDPCSLLQGSSIRAGRIRCRWQGWTAGRELRHPTL